MQSNGQYYLQVTASYDPHLASEENLTRIALNARHYMRTELEKLEPTPARVTPFPSHIVGPVEPDRVAAFDSRRHSYDIHGDEDEQTQMEP